jgi:hypothetical protein
MVDRELGMFRLDASLHDCSCLQPTRSKQSAFRSGTRQKNESILEAQNNRSTALAAARLPHVDRFRKSLASLGNGMGQSDKHIASFLQLVGLCETEKK